jgi:DNA primase
MGLYHKESLEKLKNKIDLIELLNPYVSFQRLGAYYKALCPFHEEKTPSFTVQPGQPHYHCFGCGAHGDAISFFMEHQKWGFVEAVDYLAERYGVVLEKAENPSTLSRAELKELLLEVQELYHLLLLHSEEGKEALDYLYKRGIDRDFILLFRLGYAPTDPFFLRTFFQKKASFYPQRFVDAGLIHSSGRDFFSRRITFPIKNSAQQVIGFSARKIREEDFGGKYINSPETLLFKKSQVLFGLDFSRRSIAAQRRVLLVEGQMDALRLIFSGFDYTVATLGTAFGPEGVKQLMQLGVSHVFLAFDGDEAGKRAALKAGDLFQREGIGVSVVTLPPQCDPDQFLVRFGPFAFEEQLKKSQDYLSYLYHHLAHKRDLSIPTQKNELVKQMVQQVQTWRDPVHIHEACRRIAQLAQVPEEMLSLSSKEISIPKTGRVQKLSVDSDRIMEMDLVRWLLLLPKEQAFLVPLVPLNIRAEDFSFAPLGHFYSLILSIYEAQGVCDLFSIASQLQSIEESELLEEIVQKKINLLKAEEGLKESIHKLLIRNWMRQREAIRLRLQSGECSEEEALELAKEFDGLKNTFPQVQVISV